MASFHKPLYLFFTFFFALLSFSNAYTFTVGGRDGWTLHPSESYNQFSGRLRFVVNDNLHFKYDAASDSVLEVSKGDYDNCNTNNPITTLTGGDSFFTLNRSGPFYFISGNRSHCNEGQKLEVVVISPKTNPSHSAAPPPGVSLAPMVSPGTPVSSPPESGTSGPTAPIGSPMSYSSPPEPGTSPMASPFSSPPEYGATPMGAPTGGISASPTGNPSDVNGQSPNGSPEGSPSSTSARLPVSTTLTVSFVLMIVGLVWFY
ncbi:unnamed protein product [Lactuca saligna]|uniref:Phytocyanin domain-containing protein n=1 Tax=Lactuca saligna TaxID=75948 RepID=A0AA35ZNZ1_LACSI|nr:unnamed protein product [Lactuca saligna]